MLTPPTGEKAYPLAGEALAELWEKVTGSRTVVKTWNGAASQGQDPQEKLPEGDLALIGSDAVHPLVHQLIYEVAPASGVKPAEAFQAIYVALLGKPRGPRAGWVVTVVGGEACAARFREAASA